MNKWAIFALLVSSINLQANDEIVEEVVVTGTRIERQDYVSPSPVYTIDREALLQDGTPTLTEYLNQSPQFAPADDKTSNFGGSGRGEVNLRGLGAGRSLVMIDGQRMGAAGRGSVVDLNAIPTAIIDSVETLTGGASAVYGSDAVSGVVNIKLRRDYVGLEVNAGYDITEESDGDTSDVSILWGTDFLSGAGNVSVFYTQTDRDEVQNNERDFAAQALGEDGQGNLIPDGSPVTPAGTIPFPSLVDGQFANRGLTFDPNGNIRAVRVDDVYNYYGEYNYLQIGMERDAWGAFVRYDISDSMTVHLDVTGSKRVITFEAAPDLAAHPAVTINLNNPFLTDATRSVLAANFDPGGTGFFVGPFTYRTSQLGGRELEDELKDIRVRLGLEGGLFSNWQWKLNYVWYDFEREDVQTNFVDFGNFLQSLLVDPVTGECTDPGNGCVPGNYFGAGNLSPAAANFIRAPDRISTNDTRQQILQALVNGDFELLGRDLSLVFGIERREEDSYNGYRQVGFSAPKQGGDININEYFAEAVIPIVENLPFAHALNLEAGYRYSDYDTIGSFDTWKAGVTWHFTESLMLRAMRQQAIRAPNNWEYFVEPDRGEYVGAFFGDDIDRCSASQDPVGRGIADICIAQGLAPDQVGVFEANPFYLSYNVQGPNPFLEQEQADTLTVGLTWEPAIRIDSVQNVSVALDYYEIEIDNAIRWMGRDGTQSNCYAVNDPGHDFCQAITRDATGNVAEVRVGNFNASLFTSKGIDLQVDALFSVPGPRDWYSELAISLIASKITERDTQAAPTALRFECAGLFGFPCNNDVTPEYNVKLNLNYKTGPLSIGFTWRWLDGMDFGALISGEPWVPFYTPAVPSVGSEDYLDAHFSWKINEQFHLRARIANLLDTDPPLMGYGSQQANTIPNFYDVLGRRYHLSLQYRM